VSFFEMPRPSKARAATLVLRARGIEATGIDDAEGFIVRAGSQAAMDEVPSCHAYLRDLRQALVRKGVFVDGGTVYRLTQDYTFNSPSTAAGVLLGRSSNGRDAWKDKDGRTLKEIQELQAGPG
jgi:hypothetical protein